jgi:hypothetical protein
MSGGRDQDDELEAQLAGAGLPEDEVDLFGENDHLEEEAPPSKRELGLLLTK